MLEGVGAVAVRSGGGGTWPHTANWLNGTRSRLEGKQMIICINEESEMPNFRMKVNSR